MFVIEFMRILRHAIMFMTTEIIRLFDRCGLKFYDFHVQSNKNYLWGLFLAFWATSTAATRAGQSASFCQFRLTFILIVYVLA